MPGSDWQQSNISCSFYCLGNLALMLRAVARNPSRDNLPSLADEKAQGTRILVINRHLFIGAKTADFSPLKISLFSRPVPSRWCSFFTHMCASRLIIPPTQSLQSLPQSLPKPPRQPAFQQPGQAPDFPCPTSRSDT